MNITEISINQTFSNLPLGYAPDKQCFEWCNVQNAVYYNNMETYFVLFTAGAVISISVYELLNESEKYKPYAAQFILYAKILLYIFIFCYFIVLKMRMYYYY